MEMNQIDDDNNHTVYIDDTSICNVCENATELTCSIIPCSLYVQLIKLFVAVLKKSRLRARFCYSVFWTIQINISALRAWRN